MDKFSREKARRKDRVANCGAEPARAELRRNAEYFTKEEVAALKILSAAPSRGSTLSAGTVTKDDDVEDGSEVELSPESLKMFGEILFAHPETRIDAVRELPNGDKDVTIRGNVPFITELRRPIIALDKVKRRHG